jgi:hypothetical protein
MESWTSLQTRYLWGRKPAAFTKLIELTQRLFEDRPATSQESGLTKRIDLFSISTQMRGGAAAKKRLTAKSPYKSEFDGFVDCIIIESLHNPIADA